MPQAVEAGGWVYVSSLFGVDPVTREFPADARSEAERLCTDLEAVLSAAGCGPSDVVRVGIVMRDL